MSDSFTKSTDVLRNIADHIIATGENGEIQIASELAKTVTVDQGQALYRLIVRTTRLLAPVREDRR